MFKILFYKELQENIQNFRFVIALILCVTIIPLGFYVNFKEYEAKEQNYKESVKLYEESHKTILDVMRLGGEAFRPPSPLSMLSSGVEFLLPNSVETVGYMTYRGAQTQFNNSRSLDSPFSFLYGYLDLTFIVSIIISLLAMLLTYNSLAGEKESRTLSQILSNSVSRNTIILAKMSATASLLSVLFLLGILTGVFTLILSGFELFSSGDLVLRFFLAVGFSLFYILAFLSFGILISSLNKSSISAIVSLMFCWVLLFMIFPKGSVIVSKIIKPVKSQQVIDLEKNQVRLQIRNEEQSEIQKLKETTPAIKDMSIRDFAMGLRDGDPNVKAYIDKQNEVKELYRIKSESELNKIDAFYDGKRSSQASLARNISRLSPVSCFIHLMVEISNTGFSEYRQWKQTRSRFKQLLDTEICAKSQSAQFGNFSMSDYEGDRNAPMPKLGHQPVSLNRVLSSVWPDFMLLLVYGILFFAGSYVAFLRYDVR